MNFQPLWYNYIYLKNQTVHAYTSILVDLLQIVNFGMFKVINYKDNAQVQCQFV